MPQPLTSIRLRGHRKRQLAKALLKKHPVKFSISTALIPVTIVCVSDTHNTRPVLPPGDLLIHAGDLTENGSFDEVQAGIRWLSSQPHRYKVFVPGNHDVLLDEAFLERYPARRYGQAKTRNDLEWGSVILLEDSCVTLDFPSPELRTASNRGHNGPPVVGGPKNKLKNLPIIVEV